VARGADWSVAAGAFELCSLKFCRDSEKSQCLKPAGTEFPRTTASGPRP